MKFAVIPNKLKDTDLTITKRIIDMLVELDQEAYLLKEDALLIDKAIHVIEYEQLSTVDFVVVLGGDGTILSTSRQVVEYEVPLLGINLGRLGFLAEVEIDHIKQAFKKIIKGEYTIEERMMLKINYCSKNACSKLFTALNDVVVTRGAFSRMVDLKIYINNKFIDNFTADGVIVSTPTGSTAYNLSAGGPILSPITEMMVITPICPHSLYVRSIVVSSMDHIQIIIGSDAQIKEEEIMLTIDGQTGFKLNYKDEINITKADKYTKLVKTTDNNFYDILREKMFKIRK